MSSARYGLTTRVLCVCLFVYRCMLTNLTMLPLCWAAT